MLRPFSRPKVSIYIASSIDGYIARPDGNLDWLQYGHTGDEDYGFNKFINNIDAVIMGKNTYEVVAGFDKWAYSKRVIVLSSTLIEVRKEAELFSGQLTELLAKLYSEGVGHIWVDGGVTASKFLEADLVDEITISIIAMVLGCGIPLFSTMHREHKCHLVSTQSYPSGLMQLKYEVVRDN
jgi:dihydrofolate reductase